VFSPEAGRLKEFVKEMKEEKCITKCLQRLLLLDKSEGRRRHLIIITIIRLMAVNITESLQKVKSRYRDIKIRKTKMLCSIFDRGKRERDGLLAYTTSAVGV